MSEKSMKDKLAAGELVLWINLRLARSVDIAMVAKELLRVLPPLSDALTVVAEPCAGFFHNTGLHAKIDQLANLADHLAIHDIELDLVQQRVETAAAGKLFFIDVTGSARKFLLTEGIDLRYGARPLKRAIERLLVQPLSNLMATGQIRRGDRLRVTHSTAASVLTFFRDSDAYASWGVDSAAA